MKTKLGVIAAVLACCCALVVGLAKQARAEEPCTTQGALALALADVLQIKVTVAQEAADALASRGIAPKLGWNVDACLTADVAQEIRVAFGSIGSFDRAIAMIDNNKDQQYPIFEGTSPPPTVSPFKP